MYAFCVHTTKKKTDAGVVGMWGRWKELLASATNAVEVVTFDYPCKPFVVTMLFIPFSAPSIVGLSIHDAKGDTRETSFHNAIGNSTADCANGKRGPPPKAEKLVDSHIAEIEKAVEKHSGHPLVLIGKSMGSRFFLPVSPLLCRALDFCTGIVLPFGAHWQIHGLKGSLSVFLPL